MRIQVFASGSSGNAYRIGDGDTSLLLEAGIPIKQIKQHCNFQVSSLDGCLISHNHQDHSKAGRDLIKMGVDIYASKGTSDACGFTGHRAHIIKGLQQFRIGTFDILPFDVQHDAEEPLGFLIASRKTKEKLLFFTDTYYIKHTFKGLTHIMAECNYSIEAVEENIKKGYIPRELAVRLMRSHMSIDNLIKMLKANDLSKVKQIYLLHISESNGQEIAFKKITQQLSGTEVYVC